MSHLSRAQFLSRGARGGVALAAGGSVLALASCGGGDEPAGATGREPTRTAGAGMVDDTAIAMLVATAELLAIDLYTRLIESGAAGADLHAYLEATRQNERDHYDALAEALGSQAPSGLVFAYPPGTFGSLARAATTGRALEVAFVGAYMGAVQALRDPALTALAARIGANEAQHLAALGSIAAGADLPLVPSPSMPDVLTAREATDAVTSFLA